MPGDLNSLVLSHIILSNHIREGAFCIDATAGRGRDTAFLCSLAGGTGTVYAFDIQQEALDSTQRLLSENRYKTRTKLILDSHSNVSQYAEAESVDAIVFNFGWLPGGDHGMFTMPETSIEAIHSGLTLLKVGGIMTLGIYYGGESGFAERDALLSFLPTIDYRRFTVTVTTFCNRPNNPSILAVIIKDEP